MNHVLTEVYLYGVLVTGITMFVITAMRKEQLLKDVNGDAAGLFLTCINVVLAWPLAVPVGALVTLWKYIASKSHPTTENES